MRFFLYLWDINPDDSRLIGPFDTEADARAWWKEYKEDYSTLQCAITQLPFTALT